MYNKAKNCRIASEGVLVCQNVQILAANEQQSQGAKQKWLLHIGGKMRNMFLLKFKTFKNTILCHFAKHV